MNELVPRVFPFSAYSVAQRDSFVKGTAQLFQETKRAPGSQGCPWCPAFHALPRLALPCVAQASHVKRDRSSAPGGTRTHGSRFRRAVLYPLSYGRGSRLLGQDSNLGPSG